MQKQNENTHIHTHMHAKSKIGWDDENTKFSLSGMRMNDHRHRNKANLYGLSGEYVVNDPTKIEIPTYFHFKNIDELAEKESENMPNLIRRMLLLETTDSYIKDPEMNQKFFIQLCVASIEQLGRTVGTKTILYKNLNKQIKSVIDNELREVQTEERSLKK